MTLVYIYIALLSYNVEYLTLPLGSVECIVDDAANIAVLDHNSGRVRKGGSKAFERKRSDLNSSPAQPVGGMSRHKAEKMSKQKAEKMSRQKAEKMNWRHLWNEGTDAVMDVPIGGVCEILYGEGGNGPG
jgi:phosphatidylinositol N-acetylglucosaminyltransferase subunit P